MASTMFSSSSCIASNTYRRKHGLNCNLQIRNDFVLEETSSNDRDDHEKLVSGLLKRRSLVLQSGFVPLVTSVTAFGFPAPGLAVIKQGPLAGRVPGLSEPDEQG